METNEPEVAEDDPMRAFHERLAPKLKDAEAQLMDVNEKVKTFIVENPGKCLLGACALGYIVGRLAARR